MCLLCVTISNKIIVVKLTHKIMYSTTFACLLGAMLDIGTTFACLLSAMLDIGTTFAFLLGAMLDIGTTFAQHLVTQVTKYCDDLF